MATIQSQLGLYVKISRSIGLDTVSKRKKIEDAIRFRANAEKMKHTPNGYHFRYIPRNTETKAEVLESMERRSQNLKFFQL